MFDLYIIMCYLFSSPYLLVFGDDRVRGTREQMILQVELVRLSRRVGESLRVLCYFVLQYIVNSFETFLDYSTFVIMDFGLIFCLYKCLNFPRFGK